MMKIYAKNGTELESSVNIVKICSGNTVMLPLQKCVILVIKQGKIEQGTDCMILADRGKTKTTDVDSDYKCLNETPQGQECEVHRKTAGKVQQNDKKAVDSI